VVTRSACVLVSSRSVFVMVIVVGMQYELRRRFQLQN